MSRMIPPFYDDKTSDGEKKIFHAFQGLSDDYVVLHSLGIAEHQEKVFGEIDFVIICKQGILCLEVKGGHVYRGEGMWHFTNRYDQETKKAEGPFRQVFTAMISLRKHLQKQFGYDDHLAKCQYACGVAFPDMPFTQKGPDIIQEVIFDSRQLVEDLEKYIKRVFDYWRDELRKKHDFTGGSLNIAQINKAENYLRGDFGFIPSMEYIIKQTEERLLRLTKEQTDRLSMARENPRILLKGGAGTGKTLLSLEHAKRASLTGKKVLYLCYNKNLYRYLKLNLFKNGPLENLEIDTLHGHISKRLRDAGRMPCSDGFNEKEFFRTVLPEYFLEHAKEETPERGYDLLVVDEGQDLLRYEYLLCLDSLINGGLRKGMWHICYDPNQNLYNPSLQDGEELIKEYNPTVLVLDTNCRNTKPVGVFNTLFTGITPSKFYRVDGEKVKRFSYSSIADQRKQIITHVKRLLGQGIKPGSIYLLSKFGYEKSCLQGENIFQGICSFQDATNVDPAVLTEDSLKFSTIQSFKGLESPVVFLIDVDKFSNDDSKMLNYTGMSRAKSLLYVFYKDTVEDEMLNMIDITTPLLDLIEQ